MVKMKNWSPTLCMRELNVLVLLFLPSMYRQVINQRKNKMICLNKVMGQNILVERLKSALTLIQQV